MLGTGPIYLILIGVIIVIKFNEEQEL